MTQEVVTQELAKIIDAKALYSACAGCHGKNGEKIALGKSKIIQAWSVEKLTNALNGYKDGTYGGAMKGLMKGQVAKLNADEIKAISEYISKL
ncbi:MAG: c-type cytochrome [Sulfurimonas sp.]|nr:c-type cytochrome [Sulfurimonas sp.]